MYTLGKTIVETQSPHIYASLCTELTVEVRSIYVSLVYRTQCAGAQYLCQSCVQNSVWRCAVPMSVCVQTSQRRCAVSRYVLCTEPIVEMRNIYVSLCTDLTVEVRSIYVSPVYRTHCRSAQYLCQSCAQNSLWRCAKFMSVCLQNSLWRFAVSMSVCVHNSLWKCAVSMSVLCTKLTVEVRSIRVSPLYRTHCGGAHYLCQCCV